MWLSKRIMLEQPEPDSATIGTVSIGGEDAAVVTDTEKRRAKIITPGGYCWKPGAADSVLVVKGNELYLAGTVLAGAGEIEQGEIKIYSYGSSVTLRNDGTIELSGDVTIQGDASIQGDVTIMGDLRVMGRILGES